MSNLTKKDISDELIMKFGMHEEQAKKIVDVVLDTIRENAKQGRNCEIRGFGRFKVVETKERRGRIFKTMQDVQIPPRTAIKFVPSKQFFD